MKAAVCYEFSTPLVVEEVSIRKPVANEVLVRMVSCSICYSDVHLLDGSWGGSCPVVAGHEAAGIVEAVGENVRFVKPGDKVAATLIQQCGECYQCQRAKPFSCEQPYTMDDVMVNNQGTKIQHAFNTGAFAELVLVHESQVIAIPNDINLEVVSLLSCGVMTGAGAAINTAQVQPGSSVGVIGIGGVGINVIQGARIAGAEKIIAIDIQDSKLELAHQFGATDTINSLNENLLENIFELNNGRGLDYCFAAVGHSSVFQQAFSAIAKGGVAVIVGMPSEADVMFSIDSFDLTADRRIIGSKMGSSVLSVDIPRLINWYRDGSLMLDEMISGRYSLAQINEAISATNSGMALRNVINFS